MSLLVFYSGAGAPGLTMAALDISPSKTRPNRTITVTFIGTGTTWLSGAPVFTPSGVAAVSVSGGVTVVNDTVARASVIYGANTGTLVWTDSTTSATKNQRISNSLYPRFVRRRV